MTSLDWTLAIEKFDLNHASNLLKQEPQLLWSPLQDGHLQQKTHLLQAPFYAIHFSILYFDKHKNLDFVFFLVNVLLYRILVY